MQTLSVSMLGPSGVGKTSILAAIYKNFDSVIGSLQLQLTPAPEASSELSDAAMQLEELGNSFKTNLEGTDSEKSYFFGLGKSNQRPSLQLEFIDYPGQYLNKLAAKEDKDKVYEYVRKSAATILAVDSPSLMEDGEKNWFERTNKAQYVTDIFKNTYQELDSPRLVIICPVRCEKYVKDPKKALQLVARVKEKYDILLNLLHKNENVAVVIAPVQTVGSVVFSAIEIDKDKNGMEYPTFYFKKEPKNAPYSPEDCEQPLLYILRFMLSLHLKHRTQGFWGWIGDVFGRNEDFKRAINSLLSKCKENNIIHILDGRHLLSIDK